MAAKCPSSPQTWPTPPPSTWHPRPRGSTRSWRLCARPAQAPPPSLPREKREQEQARNGPQSHTRLGLQTRQRFKGSTDQRLATRRFRREGRLQIFQLTLRQTPCRRDPLRAEQTLDRVHHTKQTHIRKHMRKRSNDTTYSQSPSSSTALRKDTKSILKSRSTRHSTVSNTATFVTLLTLVVLLVCEGLFLETNPMYLSHQKMINYFAQHSH